MRNLAIPLIAGLVVLVGMGASARPIEGIVFFGDSFTDAGAAYELTAQASPPSPPYFAGRFADGPVWADLLASELGLPSIPVVNIAMGGAGTGFSDVPMGLLTQVDEYLGDVNQVPAGWLAAVYIATNNYLGATADPNVPIAPGPVVATALGHMETAFRTLVANGADRILVPNIPELWSFPLRRDEPLHSRVRVMVELHNAQLLVLLSELSAELGVEFIHFDTATVYRNIIQNPAAFGFTDVLSPCIDFPNLELCDDPEGTLFFDLVHPNGRSHAVLAREMALVIQPPVYTDVCSWILW